MSQAEAVISVTASKDITCCIKIIIQLFAKQYAELLIFTAKQQRHLNHVNLAIFQNLWYSSYILIGILLVGGPFKQNGVISSTTSYACARL